MTKICRILFLDVANVDVLDFLAFSDFTALHGTIHASRPFMAPGVDGRVLIGLLHFSDFTQIKSGSENLVGSDMKFEHVLWSCVSVANRCDSDSVRPGLQTDPPGPLGHFPAESPVA